MDLKFESSSVSRLIYGVLKIISAPYPPSLRELAQHFSLDALVVKNGANPSCTWTSHPSRIAIARLIPIMTQPNPLKICRRPKIGSFIFTCVPP
jgi:hypothetical protein